ncbi:MAG: hypothetical protein ACYC1C_20150, partial [Chloroflexota bacterium]
MPDKWEREIEEVIRKKYRDEGGPRYQPPRRQEPRRPRRNWLASLNSLSPERLLVYGVVMALAAYFARMFFPGAAFFLVLASVVLIFGAVAISVLKHESPYVERRWRGRTVEPPSRPRPVNYSWYRFRHNVRRWL